MNIQPRPYRNDQDLTEMRHLLAAGRKADNGTYYVHPGDLDWWLHYLSQEDNREQTIFLWEDNAESDYLLGWTLLSPEWNAVDVFVHPDLRGTTLSQRIWEWAVKRLVELESSQKSQKICSMWIDEKDEAVIEILENLGFQKSNAAMHYLECVLSDRAIASAVLPGDYTIRGIYGEKELEKRAAVSYAAFGSKKPFDRYVSRYLKFMHSPVYQAERDLVIVTPDGDFAGFCIIWLDDENQIGLFEPVGVHPQYQKRGFGKALMLAGLEKMKIYSMQKAVVCSEHDNPAAFKLYQSAGFKPLKKLRTFTKNVSHQTMDGLSGTYHGN